MSQRSRDLTDPERVRALWERAGGDAADAADAAAGAGRSADPPAAALVAEARGAARGLVGAGAHGKALEVLFDRIEALVREQSGAQPLDDKALAANRASIAALLDKAEDLLAGVSGRAQRLGAAAALGAGAELA